MLTYSKTPIVEWRDNQLPVRILIKLEYLNHPLVSGNKWWKLKYNLQEMQRQGHTTMLTFGGAYSNHIFATAAAAKETGVKSIGIIRGEEVSNPTLTFAKKMGMQLHFMSREEYRHKTDPDFVDTLTRRFGDFFLIPEGGTNELAVRGCAEFGALVQSEKEFDFICLPVGTGGTMAGIVSAMNPEKHVIGFASLKGADFLSDEVRSLSGQPVCQWRLETNYHFGGYAKRTAMLDDFIAQTKAAQNIDLDPVYTAKMMYGVIEMARNNNFPAGSTVMVVHTGGLQGGLYQG